MAAIAQLGTTVEVGFGSITNPNFVMEDSSEAIIGDIEEIRDANNDQATKLISARGHRYRLSGVILNSGNNAERDAVRALVVGGTVSVNGTNCMVEAVEISYTRTAMKASITAVDDAISY